MVSVAVDVKEVSTAYIFEGDMPGLKNTDIKVHLRKRVSLCRILMLHENRMIGYSSEWIYYKMTFPLEREPWFVSQGVIYMPYQKQKVMDTWYYHHTCEFLRYNSTQPHILDVQHIENTWAQFEYQKRLRCWNAHDGHPDMKHYFLNLSIKQN